MVSRVFAVLKTLKEAQDLKVQRIVKVSRDLAFLKTLKVAHNWKVPRVARDLFVLKATQDL